MHSGLSYRFRGCSTMSRTSGNDVIERFHHQAVLYDGLRGLVEAVVPFIREGVQRGEPVLVAQPLDRLNAVRFALGPDAGGVRFLDMAAIGRNPACLLSQWQEFLEAQPGDGPVRGVAEPVWRGRRDPELDECRLHEALLNVAFAGGRTWQLLCPYDVASLPGSTVADARRTHPLVGRWPGEPSDTYAGPGVARDEFTRPLPPAPPQATEMQFRGADLAALRGVVRRHVETAGMGGDAADDLVLAVHELATNSVLHGGGRGTLRCWMRPDAVVLEIADGGVIADPLVGREASAPFDENGRGLWIANQLCDLVQVRSSARGTTVRLHVWR